jgi:hypothetical protein
VDPAEVQLAYEVQRQQEQRGVHRKLQQAAGDIRA